MRDTALPPSGPENFSAAVRQLRAANLRTELRLSEIPSPSTSGPHAIATNSFALSADVTPARHDVDSPLGTGRFILLHDPSAPSPWAGEYRVVCFAQAPLESELTTDPFLADVVWSWLGEALAATSAGHHSLAGTVTKILSTGYGELAQQGDGAQVELRASWSPAAGDLSSHVESWGELLCTLAGLPPTIEGVTVLSVHRAGRE
ncbi:MAG: DUF3000 domain-containing protein [Microbacteriaceae bacterium]|nr:DUF3000 domain-containing protein [Microbacteriaceae bacterium]